MPVPTSISIGTGRLMIRSDFRIAIVHHGDARMLRAIRRAIPRLERRTGLALTHAVVHDTTGATLIIDCSGPGERVQSVNEDESYALTATPHAVTLRAPTTVGVIRGLETVLQLVASDSAGFFIPAVSISDTPRFRWRGLLVDVSRHFEPVDEIQRTLDGMSAVKLNVLHWHLSDDQGIRVESHRYPRLQRLASDSLYYTQAQIRHVVAYARDRGIRVVPEFDMPGHSTAWFVAYPQYASGPGPYELGRHWAGYPGIFDPTRASVYRFIDRFIGEMTTLFPDAYYHIGGDEVEAKQWNDNPRIQSFMRAHHLADNAALQAYFNQRLSRILTRHHRHMVGWDEILHPDLPRTTVVQSWRGTKYLGQAAAQGFDGILSAPYYLDAMKSAEQHYLADPLAAEASLTPEQASHVLGGEACMWSEVVDSTTIDSRIWPRLAAIAERFWSPASITDVNDMYRRLWIESIRLEESGLRHESHTARAIRHMALSPSDYPLRTLLQFTEPVTLGQRTHGRPTVQSTPLVDLVDAAVPDPPARWMFQQYVTAVLSDSAAAPRSGYPTEKAATDSLRTAFAEWNRIRTDISMHPVVNPLAVDAIRASNALASVGEIGAAVLNARTHGTTLPSSWIDSALVTLTAADRPQGMLHLVVVSSIRQLLNAGRSPTTTTLH